MEESSLSLSWKFLLISHSASGPSALTFGSAFRLTGASIPREERRQGQSLRFVLLNIGEPGWNGDGL